MHSGFLMYFFNNVIYLILQYRYFGFLLYSLISAAYLYFFNHMLILFLLCFSVKFNLIIVLQQVSNIS